MTPRRAYNSNDFQPEPEKPAQLSAAVQMADGATHKEKEKKRKKSLIKETPQKQKAESTIEVVKSTPDISETKEQRKARRKREKEEAAQTSEPHKKKRKRASETCPETPTAARDGTANASFVVGTHLVENVMASLSGRETLTLEKPKVKKHRKSKSETVQQQKGELLPNIKTSSKTPVPLPQLSHVLVPETPPSKAARKDKSASRDLVSLSQSRSQSQPQPVGNAAMQRKPPRKERVTVFLSTPTSASDTQTPKSAPPAMTNGVTRPTVPNALTDANLSSHSKPSTKEAKLKQPSKSAMSSVTSLLESASTRSIMEAFARVGKPYARSGAVVDPFVAPEVLVKQLPETHEEASMNVFNDKFRELQKAVNFSEERGYLDDYLAWSVDNASKYLPCLGNVTGCTSKKEEILRLSKEENLTILSHLDTEAGDLNALRDAANRIRLADELLMLSLKARVPVPIGRLEGTWTLYCPKYAETHFDRYGYGQRTLTISSIAGFKHKNSYTARLNIPPRSMSYSILAFSTPPHASFRTTTVKTAAEGYTMDIVFLGNGYLQLRADLKLLLKGKAIDKFYGKKVHMEFIGMHEKAVKWFEEKNELEEEAKKLFAKYDGSAEE